jgi:hypothetical protein
MVHQETEAVCVQAQMTPADLYHALIDSHLPTLDPWAMVCRVMREVGRIEEERRQDEERKQAA